MFVLSVKASRKKLLLAVAAVVAVILVLILVGTARRSAVQTSAGYQLQAADDAQRRAFLSQYGWETGEEPTEICEVIIPETFDAVYQKYNDLQKTQEFDLTRFQGKRVKRWTYEIQNYPGYEGTVYANLLVYDGAVIGGDVCSKALDGFMQGFRRNSEPISLSSQPGASEAASETPSVPEASDVQSAPVDSAAASAA